MKRKHITLITAAAAGLLANVAIAQPGRAVERPRLQHEGQGEGIRPGLFDGTSGKEGQKPRYRVQTPDETFQLIQAAAGAKPKPKLKLNPRASDGSATSRAVESLAEAKAESAFADALKKYERELADLNAATQRRRAELMQKLAETKAKQAEAALRRQAKKMERSPIDAWMSLDLTGLPPAPAWVIGVAVKGESEAEGVEVERVFEDKPAAAAGIRAGDVIVGCNGIKLRDRDALVKVLLAAQDQEIALKVKRSGKDEGGGVTEPKELEIKITPVRSEVPVREKPLPRVGPDPYRLRQQAWPNNVPGPQHQLPQGNYYEFFNAPNRAAAEQLKKDNAELKALLKQLIEEVKKLGD